MPALRHPTRIGRYETTSVAGERVSAFIPPPSPPVMEQQIRTNADEIDSWDEYRFVMPPFSAIGGIARLRQTFGGEEGLASMLASLNAAVFGDGGAEGMAAGAPA